MRLKPGTLILGYEIALNPILVPIPMSQILWILLGAKLKEKRLARNAFQDLRKNERDSTKTFSPVFWMLSFLDPDESNPTTTDHGATQSIGNPTSKKRPQNGKQNLSM